MANISKLMGVPIGNFTKVMGVSKSTLSKIMGLSLGVPVSGAVLHIDASLLGTGTGINAATTPVSNLGSQGGSFNVGNYDVEASGIGTKNALKFNGTSQYLYSANAYSNSGTTMTMFIVQQRISDKGDYVGSICSVFSGSSDWNDIRSWTYNENLSNIVVERNGVMVHITIPGDGVNFIGTVKFDGTNVTHYLRKASGTTTAGPTTKSGSFGCTETVLGARQAPGVSYYANINIGEVLIYNSALSDADRTAVEDYLAAKWGI